MTVRTWQLEHFRVECPIEIIQQISAAAREGFMRFPHGGVEVGGILAGKRTGDLLQIREARPIPIEYARGASFSLIPDDEKALHALATETRGIAGWYVSHTRRDLHLSQEDCDIFDRFFAFDDSVCLVIKPAVGGSETLALYVRGSDGNLTEAGAYEDIEMEGWAPPALTTEPAATLPANDDAAPLIEQPAAPAPIPHIEPAPTRVMVHPTDGASNRRKWYIGTAAAVALLAIPTTWYVRHRAVDASQGATTQVGERERTAPPPLVVDPPVRAQPAAQQNVVAEEKPSVKPAARKKGKSRRARTRHNAKRASNAFQR